MDTPDAPRPTSVAATAPSLPVNDPRMTPEAIEYRRANGLVERDEFGRLLPGSQLPGKGRKGGPMVTTLARQHTEAAVSLLAEVMRDGKVTCLRPPKHILKRYGTILNFRLSMLVMSNSASVCVSHLERQDIRHRGLTPLAYLHGSICGRRRFSKPCSTHWQPNVDTGERGTCLWRRCPYRAAGSRTPRRRNGRRYPENASASTSATILTINNITYCFKLYIIVNNIGNQRLKLWLSYTTIRPRWNR